MTTADNSAVHYRNCTICEAVCGLEITVHADQRLDIRGDKDDPFSRGYICPKAVALQDIHHDEDRLTHPVRRTQHGWQRIGWDEAFDEVAHNLKRVQARYGRNAVATYQGNPVTHNLGALLFAPGFIRSLHTRNRFSATSVDQLAHHVAAYFMFGHQLLLPVPDLDRTNFLLILGANPAVSNGSLMTAPDVRHRLQEIRRRGGRVILVDPRATETARLADRHLFIRPGTDVLLLLALLHVVFAEALTRPSHLAAFTDGVETVGRLVADFPPERVAAVTGIDAGEIRTLAREFAAAEAAVCYGRIGVSTQEFGAACQWLINVLNVVTGNLDRPGGAMFTRPAFDPLSAPEALASRGGFARWHSRVRRLPEFAGEFPVVTLAEEILTEGPGQVRALVTFAGNPVLSTPNGRKLDAALAGLDFMVSVDFYINETTRHAHVILPPCSPLERAHYDLVFYILGVRDVAKFSPALFQPGEGARQDWEILLELQTRMEHGGRFGRLLGRAKRKFVKRFVGPERMLDLALRFGPYGSKLNPAGRGLTLRKLREAVHGLDLGALRPCLPGRLRTPGKRIELAPGVLVKDIERVKAKLLDGATRSARDGALLLVGRRQLRSNNSWLHNSHRLVRDGGQCTVLMHPADAARRQLRQGQNVSVRSGAGAVVLPLEVSDEMMPGVVSMPHGWGHGRDGVQLAVARRHAGASVNDVTDELTVDALCGTAAFNGTWVFVEATD
ncbi:MAG TPA: molybdopterin-dependent oxidoreductase [Pyrinomonadaceae bacterium]|jgi:anaerobic selenocysteine-containing dehydrogenase